MVNGKGQPLQQSLSRKKTPSRGCPKSTAAGRFASIFLLLSLMMKASYAQPQGDFLIVEQPQNLLINNQYQQQMSPEEKNGLLPFTPFRILKTDDMLGDNLTPCIKAELNGGQYYLLKEENGNLASSGPVGFKTRYDGATLLYDTVEVLGGNNVAFLSPTQNTRSGMIRGTPLLRIFRHNGNTYAKSLFPERYGWVNLEESAENKDWKLVKGEAPSVTQQLQRVLPSLILKVEEVNKKFTQLFHHFNKSASAQREAPRWRVQTTSTGVVCLLETSSSLQGFSESSTLLGKNIESVLLGTNLQVLSSPGRIEIR